MKILVLGAGVVGTTAAYYLARDGHEVTVIERHARRRAAPAIPMPGWCRPATPRRGPRRRR